jgi:hypothetical protein
MKTLDRICARYLQYDKFGDKKLLGPEITRINLAICIVPFLPDTIHNLIYAYEEEI